MDIHAKNELVRIIARELNEDLQRLDEAIDSLQEGRAADGKSSAGDKHETSRAMVDIELEQLEALRLKTAKLKTDLQSLNLDPAQAVRSGSVVRLEHAHFFLSISRGRIPEWYTETVYAVSPVSPIGQALLHASKGDAIAFQGKSFTVLDVY